ncbi:hypothetical protein C8J57DRAFT_1516583 [Mycena rebaudengoi]|nr:hypothetical protein C8J57DRAFT_1516583 [Mycena rebaudengoi]
MPPNSLLGKIRCTPALCVVLRRRRTISAHPDATSSACHRDQSETAHMRHSLADVPSLHIAIHNAHRESSASRISPASTTSLFLHARCGEQGARPPLQQAIKLPCIISTSSRTNFCAPAAWQGIPASSAPRSSGASSQRHRGRGDRRNLRVACLPRLSPVGRSQPPAHRAYRCVLHAPARPPLAQGHLQPHTHRERDGDVRSPHLHQRVIPQRRAAPLLAPASHPAALPARAHRELEYEGTYLRGPHRENRRYGSTGRC